MSAMRHAGDMSTQELDWPRLAAALRRSREAQGLTMGELSERADVNRSTIHNLESARYGKGFNRIPASLQPVIEVLGWPTGKVETLLAGHEFDDVPPFTEARVDAEDLRQALSVAMVAATDTLTAAEIREISQRAVEELARRGII